jgi:signal transduction histidine kinase
LVLVGYVAFAFSAAALLTFRPQSWALPPLATHAVDLSVAAAVTLFSSDINNPFWVLFLFTLLAAAYRWGFVATVATAGAAVSLLVVEALVIGSALRGSGPYLQGQVGTDRLIMRSAYLLLAGVLTGYLAESEKQFRAEIAAVADIISRADVRAGLKQTMAAVFDGLLRLFNANRALLIVHETGTDQLFLWEAGRRVEGSAQEIRSQRIESDSLPIFMFAPAAVAWHAVRRGSGGGERLDIVALDRGGSRLGNSDRWTLPPEFVTLVQPFDQLMAVGIELGNEWTGRLFLVDPVAGVDRTSVLGLGLRIVQQVAPAVQNVYLLRRLRSAAAATERGHIARELHDGVIQSVTGVEIQVAALSLRLAKESPAVANELRRLKMILREEVVGLRELMHKMKPLELGPHQLVDALEDAVQRFQRETGISARFVTQLDRVALTPRACREMAQILHEALVNVRRHSGARNVFVRLTAVNGDCRLSIDDDGCGFPFAGRFSQADLEATRRGPLVIKERVRLLGGELIIESDPGRGARLEIAVPISTHGLHR